LPFIVYAFAETIDQEKQVKHSKLADELESVISDPAKINVKLKVRYFFEFRLIGN